MVWDVGFTSVTRQHCGKERTTNCPKKQTHADDTFISLTYDANSNLTSLSDEKGNTTTYEYDGLNRLTKRTNPLGQFSLYQYDYHNNLTQSIDRKGQVTTLQYDGRDDLTRTTLVDGTSIERTYDAVGRLVASNDSHDGRIDWQYDILDRVIAETTAQGTAEYGFDSEGRRLSLSAPQGYQVNYGYDVADRVSSITRSGRSFLMGYDAADRMTTLAMPNGVSANNSFDSAGRLSRILYSKNAQSIKDLQYSYDAADQISRIEGTPSHTLGDTPVASAAVNQNNQYTTFGTESLQHDANGNLTNKGQASYQWDVRDRLIGMTSAGLTASFSYGPLGRRAGKTVNGTTTNFLYDGPDIIEDSTAQYTQGDGIDNVLERVAGGNSEYFLKDHLGSTIGLTDGNGNVTAQYGYSAFGQVAKIGTSSNYFTFTGREDDGTGLSYYRARYYSPELKRFTAEDPIGFASGDTNPYTYVSNNPAAFKDPDGTIPVAALPLIAGAVGGALGTLASELSVPNGSRGGDLALKTLIGAGAGAATAYFAPAYGLPSIAAVGAAGNIAQSSVGRRCKDGPSVLLQMGAEGIAGAVGNLGGAVFGKGLGQLAQRNPYLYKQPAISSTNGFVYNLGSGILDNTVGNACGCPQ